MLRFATHGPLETAGPEAAGIDTTMALAMRTRHMLSALWCDFDDLALCGCGSAAPAAPAGALAKSSGSPAAVPVASAPASGASQPQSASSEAMSSVPSIAPAPPAAPYKNTIRWSTASEVDSFGFDVFRGELEEGPFERLNAKPIPGAGTSDESHSYAFVDETIDPTKDYFYYVESIAIDGVRERFTPVNRARAKVAPATTSPASAAAEEAEQGTPPETPQP